jgi:[acyl-carrier-protein] S-malonyltransferase
LAKTAFLFPGQGAQTVGMGQSLCAASPAAAEIFRRADDVLGYGLSDICFNGPKETLDATEHSQPALLVCSIAALESLRESDADAADGAATCAGLSLGEYTAMVYAGALSFEDGLRVVRQRGLAMQEAADAQPSGMVSVLGLDDDKVVELCDAARLPGEILQVANMLCPGNIAVSGHAGSCRKVVEMAESFGAMRAVPLSVAGAFHTDIMRSAEARLAQALTDVKIHQPRIPVISNVDASAHFEADAIRQILIHQVCSPVQWSLSMQRMIAGGVDRFVEIGNGRVLRGLLKRISRQVECAGVPE